MEIALADVKKQLPHGKSCRKNMQWLGITGTMSYTEPDQMSVLVE